MLSRRGRNAAIGVNITHVPYRGAAPAMQDLIAGRIDYQCPDSPIAIPQIESKTVKAIAMLTKERSRILPDVPTAHEQGLTDFDSGTTSTLRIRLRTRGEASRAVVPAGACVIRR